MPDIPKRLDAVIDGAIASGRIAGAGVLASLSGGRIYARAAGLADREASMPVQQNAFFRLASVSKLYTLIAAMILVERSDLR